MNGYYKVIVTMKNGEIIEILSKVNLKYDCEGRLAYWQNLEGDYIYLSTYEILKVVEKAYYE